MLIVSLSSIPPRFDRLGPTLESLTRQTAKVDRILLYLPKAYRRFPDYDGRLPEVPEGVEIRRIDEDYGPATKVLGAAREFRGADCDILFCDDDRIYAPDWAAAFVTARRTHPEACIAIAAREAGDLFDSRQIRGRQPRAVQRNWRTDIRFLARYAAYLVKRRIFSPVEKPSRIVFRKAGYTDLLMGFGGVLVRPDFFDDAAFDIPEICWRVDDIWLSGMLARNGIPIWTPANCRQPAQSLAHYQAPLSRAVIDGFDYDGANRACYDYLRKTYGIWP